MFDNLETRKEGTPASPKLIELIYLWTDLMFDHLETRKELFLIV